MSGLQGILLLDIETYVAQYTVGETISESGTPTVVIDFEYSEYATHSHDKKPRLRTHGCVRLVNEQLSKQDRGHSQTRRITLMYLNRNNALQTSINTQSEKNGRRTWLTETKTDHSRPTVFRVGTQRLPAKTRERARARVRRRRPPHRLSSRATVRWAITLYNNTVIILQRSNGGAVTDRRNNMTTNNDNETRINKIKRTGTPAHTPHD